MTNAKIILVCAMAVFSACLCSAQPYFVSPAGADANPGTLEKPFATLQRAQRAAHQNRGDVFLRGGTYYLSDTLVFTARDSGTKDAPVVFQNYQNEKPVISGGVRLENLNWQPDTNGIFQAQVPADLQTEEIFVNGQRQILARYPNFDPNAKYFDGFTSGADIQRRATRWADPTGGYWHAMHPALWGDFTWRITGKDADGNLTKVGGWQNNRGGGINENIQFVENIFEELDAPGEWFLNSNTHTLYFYSPAGLDLKNAVVEATRLRTLIEFRGDEAHPVRWIALRGLIFRQAARTVMDTREPLLRSDWAIYRGGAIFFSGAEDCALEDSCLDQLGGNAVFVNNYNRRVTIRGCHIDRAGANGICFVGDPNAARSPLFNYGQRNRLADIDRTPGPKTDNYPADCRVDDCLIHETGRVEKQTAGVEIDLAQSITIRHCSIYDAPRAGINIGDGCWGGHVIEFCDVFDTVEETGDHGSFNSWGRDRYWLPDTGQVNAWVRQVPELPLLDAVKPITLRNNRWRCDHGWDIDLDDGSANYIITNNLCLHGGLKNREGYHRVVENNIIVDSTYYPQVWFANSGDVFERNLVWGDYDPARMYRPPWGREMDYNLVQKAGAQPSPATGLQRQSGRDEHSIVADAEFVDPAKGDYRVKPGSPALALGFVNFPMDQFGVQRPELKAIARIPRLPQSEMAVPASAVRDAAPDSIPYATMQVISNGDSDAVIAEKAAKVLPRPNQTDWMRLEWTFFLHYGPNAFHGVEWGSGREEPSLFNPTAFDADQWVRAMKDAGGKMIVLVCKHHDGLCLWQTRYTSHSVASSPWLDGKGDEVRAVADAAHKYGLKLGVYLSPADLYQLRTNPKNPGGYYGDGSSNVLSVIPTDPASFKTNPVIGRAPAPGFTNYTYTVDDYNRYFLNQLYELLTEYGPIEEVWFDGANPDPSVHETYDYNAWYDLIRRLQPGAVIMGKGPDVRWVGNEGGVGRTTEWSVIPLPTAPDKFRWPDMTSRDLGSRARLKPGSHLWWYPAEINVTILANGAWFWAPQKHPRSLSELVDIYYRSIGRNGNLILNLSPDSRGLIPDDQLEALSRMAEVIRDTFATNLAAGGKLTADNSNDSHGPSLALDGSLDSWWEAAPGRTNATVTLTLPAPVTFDVVSLQEAVDHRGQRIESFAIDVWNGSAWTAAEPVGSDELTTVGHRRIIRLRSPVTTSHMRIHIIGSRLEPTLAEMGLFKQSIYGLAPAISDRSADNLVTLSNASGCKMVYTVNGTEPATTSPVYTSPIRLPLTGTVKAACVMPNGKLGIVASKIFAGLPPAGWKVVAVDSQETAGENNAAANAIDGNSSTFWHTRWNEDLKLPHFITVDMGTSHRVGGFTYLPRQDGNPNGTVERYRFETSADGTNWTTNIVSGAFANVRNNPSLQQVTFAPVTARFFRFTALREVSRNGWTSAAEISVLPAGRNGDGR